MSLSDRQLIALALLRHRKKVGRPFPEQDAFVGDLSQFLAACTTRRAGKSTGLARRFYKQMEKHPGSLSRYIALTRDSARDIMLPALMELNDLYNWQAKFVENPLTMTIPNGAKLRLIGADMKNFIPRLRGAKTVANAIDEAQSFGPHLESLVNDVIVPTMADYEDSWLAVTGTPGPVPRGFFYDITEGGIGDYSMHRWSLLNNPHLPNPKEFIEKLKQRQKWDDDNPTLLREWMGRWVLDLNALLIKYSETKNHYDELPHHAMHYIIGVDIGHKDADAIAVLGWSDFSSKIYLIEEIVTKEQDLTTLATQLDAVVAKYKPDKLVMDEGALGKKIAEEFRRRKHIPVQPADKHRKMENVALLNDWLRRDLFFAKKNSLFAQESYSVQIDYEHTTPDRLVVKKGFHSDIIDAVLYAFRESPAFNYTQPIIKPKWGTEEWRRQEATRMESEAQEYFENLERIDGLS